MQRFLRRALEHPSRRHDALVVLLVKPRVFALLVLVCSHFLCMPYCIVTVSALSVAQTVRFTLALEFQQQRIDLLIQNRR